MAQGAADGFEHFVKSAFGCCCGLCWLRIFCAQPVVVSVVLTCAYDCAYSHGVFVEFEGEVEVVVLWGMW